MRIGPGFPLTAAAMSADGCTLTITEDGSSSGVQKYKVVSSPNDYSWMKWGQTAADAVEQAAAQMENSSKSLRELAKLLKGP